MPRPQLRLRLFLAGPISCNFFLPVKTHPRNILRAAPAHKWKSVFRPRNDFLARSLFLCVTLCPPWWRFSTTHRPAKRKNRLCWLAPPGFRAL